MDCSPLDSSVHGILQTRILEWVAIPSSRGSSWLRDQTCVSCIAGGFFATCSKFWATSHRKDFQEGLNQPVFSTVPMTQRKNFFLPSIRVPLVSVSFHHLTASKTKQNKKSLQSCHLYGNSFFTMLICNNFSVTALKENTIINRMYHNKSIYTNHSWICISDEGHRQTAKPESHLNFSWWTES